MSSSNTSGAHRARIPSPVHGYGSIRTPGAPSTMRVVRPAAPAHVTK